MYLFFGNAIKYGAIMKKLFLILSLSIFTSAAAAQVAGSPGGGNSGSAGVGISMPSAPRTPSSPVGSSSFYGAGINPSPEVPTGTSSGMASPNSPGASSTPYGTKNSGSVNPSVTNNPTKR